MDEIGEALRTVWPALAFLCAGVPLAALLDRSGFFEATVAALARRRPELAVGHLWVLAAVTTVVLNLDTTIVLLTPLAVRLARRAGAEVVSVALVPLLLASLASSALPVSNLTTLIVVEGRDPSVGDVLAHLGLPTLAAVGVGWLAYRRRGPARWCCLRPARRLPGSGGRCGSAPRWWCCCSSGSWSAPTWASIRGSWRSWPTSCSR
jgi:arsenical pump membrane protein